MGNANTQRTSSQEQKPKAWSKKEWKKFKKHFESIGFVMSKLPDGEMLGTLDRWKKVCKDSLDLESDSLTLIEFFNASAINESAT